MKIAVIWADEKDALLSPSRPTGKEISAYEAVREVRSGLTNSDLMKKYGISPKGLEDLFEQLVGEGLLLPSELQFRLSALEAALDTMPLGAESKKDQAPPSEWKAVWNCPACGRSQPREFEECPVCGVIVAKYRPRSSDENDKR